MNHLPLNIQFEIKAFRVKIGSLDRDNMLKGLLGLYTQFMIMENHYQQIIRKNWGIDGYSEETANELSLSQQFAVVSLKCQIQNMHKEQLTDCYAQLYSDYLTLKNHYEQLKDVKWRLG